MKIQDERGYIIEVSEEEALQRLRKRNAEDIAKELFNNNSILIIDENHYKELCFKITDLEAKLAEKEKEIQSLKLLIDSVDHYKQYHKDANLVILNPENCYADGYKVVIKTDNQTAIDELEKVFRDFNKKVDDEFGDNDINYITLDIEDVNFYLQDKIKSLKGEV